MTNPFSPVPVFARTSIATLEVQRRVEERGGLPEILHRLGNGEPQSKVANAFGMTRADIRRYVRSLPPAQLAELQDAENEGAAKMMEDTIIIADETAEKIEWDEASKPADIIKASAQRIGVRQFYAERIDKEKWSPKATTEVNLSFGGVFIDALRRRTSPTQPDSTKEIPADFEFAPVADAPTETLADFL